MTTSLLTLVVFVARFVARQVRRQARGTSRGQRRRISPVCVPMVQLFSAIVLVASCLPCELFSCLASYSLALRAILLPCEPFSCLASYSLALRAILLPCEPFSCLPCELCPLPSLTLNQLARLACSVVCPILVGIPLLRPLAPSLYLVRSFSQSLAQSLSLSISLSLSLSLARALSPSLPPSLPPCLFLSLYRSSLSLMRARALTRAPLSPSLSRYLPLCPIRSHPSPRTVVGSTAS